MKNQKRFDVEVLEPDIRYCVFMQSITSSRIAWFLFYDFYSIDQVLRTLDRNVVIAFFLQFKNTRYTSAATFVAFSFNKNSACH